MKFSLTLGRRLLLLLCFFVAGYVLVSILAAVMIMVFGQQSTPAMRILTVLQDIIVFIVPAVGTAMLVTRRPDQLLAVDRRPPLLPTLIALGTLVASIPAMNLVIHLNESLPLPPEVALTFRDMETSAAEMISAVVGPHTIPNLIMTVLIIGIMAGLSEELLFRGCLQRLLRTGGMSAHAAIWIAAAVFSLLHMQFYGFVPRMLLGAFFGYLLWWTGSLWVPVILHITNNTLYLIDEYRAFGTPAAADAAQAPSVAAALGSAILTGVGLYIIHRITRPADDSSASVSH